MRESRLTGALAARRFCSAVRESSRMKNSRRGGASVLVSSAVFKTVSESVRAGLGGFDSHTPPPIQGKSKKVKGKTFAASYASLAFSLLPLAFHLLPYERTDCVEYDTGRGSARGGEVVGALAHSQSIRFQSQTLE